jgi:hypothetical protein
VTLNGGGGSNSLSFDDRDDPLRASYDILPTEIFASNAAPIDYGNMQAVTINGNNVGSTFWAPRTVEGSSLTLSAGNGVNTVTLGDPFGGLGDMRGRVGVSGAPLGFTTLTLDDRANSTVGRSYLLERLSLFLPVWQVAIADLGRVAFSGIESFVLDAGSGGNDIGILDTPADLPVTINAGKGPDEIHAGDSVGGDGRFVRGPLTVNGGGKTTFTIFDQTTSTPETYTLTDTTVRRGNFGVIYANLQRLIINGGSGGDQFVVMAEPAATAVTLNGGSDTDTLTGPPSGPTLVNYTIDGPGSGRAGANVRFTAMDNLVSGKGSSRFQFIDDGSLAGTITGNGGDDVLDYSGIDDPVTIKLQTLSAPRLNGGAAGGFSGIRAILGSLSAANTVIGPDVDTLGWRVRVVDQVSAQDSREPSGEGLTRQSVAGFRRPACQAFLSWFPTRSRRRP